jgi:hypothetical protein
MNIQQARETFSYQFLSASFFQPTIPVYYSYRFETIPIFKSCWIHGNQYQIFFLIDNILLRIFRCQSTQCNLHAVLTRNWDKWIYYLLATERLALTQPG